MPTKQTPSRSRRCPTCGRRPKRTSEQNRMYWALLAKMAARKWDGKQYTDKSFHLYYRSRFLGCEDIELPNGQILTQPLSTADEDIPEFAEYFDKVQADAAERGVYLDE